MRQPGQLYRVQNIRSISCGERASFVPLWVPTTGQKPIPFKEDVRLDVGEVVMWLSTSIHMHFGYVVYENSVYLVHESHVATTPVVST